jgi:hypothetical protein
MLPAATAAEGPIRHWVTAVSARDPALCEMNIGRRDGIQEGDAISICHPYDRRRMLGEVQVIALRDDKSVGRGMSCQVNWPVRPKRDRGIQRVVADGLGRTPDEALQDAFRKAVSIVAGTIVNAESRIENDRLVEDRLLTFSDGYVEQYQELEAATSQAGLIRRRIVAVVRRDDMLLAAGLGGSSVDATGLFAEAFTKRQRREDAAALLDQTLRLFPAELLQAELVGRPQVLRSDPSGAEVSHLLTLRVDARKYDAAQARLVNVLRALARYRGTVRAQDSAVHHLLQSSRNELFREKFFSAARQPADRLTLREADFGELRYLENVQTTGLPPGVRKAEPTGPGFLFVVKSSAEWQWFELAESPSLPPPHAALVLRYCDADGREIRALRLPLGPTPPTRAQRPSASGYLTVFISPYFLYFVGEGFGVSQVNFASSVTLRADATLAEDQLRNAKTLDAQIRAAAAAERQP